MNMLFVPAFALLTIAFLVGCEESLTEIDQEATPVMKKGGNKKLTKGRRP